MKFLLITLLYVGILFLIVGYIRSRQLCPPPQIKYRYVPRTFEESQLDPVSVDEIFGKMFRQPTVWVASFGDLDRPNKRGEDANKFFTTEP